MALFDRPYTTFYWSTIVTITLSCTLTLNNIMTLKSGLEVTQDHSNWYHSKIGYGFQLAVYSNYGCIFSHFGDIQHQRMAWP